MAQHHQSSICCNDDPRTGYTLCISNDGDLYSFGCSPQGAHGHEEEFVTIPTVIPSLKTIKSISCSEYHTVCLDLEGSVFTFGCNQFGKLGIGKDESELGCTHIPQHIDLPPVKQVLCSHEFTLCVSEDGYLYSCGNNNYGQLGFFDSLHSRNTLQKIESLENVDFVACGGSNVLCKTFDNEIYGWGSNEKGTLGLGIQEEDPTKAILKIKNWPDDVVDIKCGYFHTLVLTSTQDVYSCGDNFYGQLGRESERDICTFLKKIPNLLEIRRIECGYDHSMCIDNNNAFIVFGCNSFGQLGMSGRNKKRPIKHPLFSSILQVIDISSGGMHSFIKLSTDSVFAFGNNTYSQLGKSGENAKQTSPVQVFRGNEDIWCTSIGKSNAKSARK